MASSEDLRRRLLRRFVAFELPIEAVKKALAAFPFDSESELVTVTAADLLPVLERCLNGQVSADQVAEWADFLEMRDDVGFDSADGGHAREVIFELANPDLCGAITPQKLEALRIDLMRSAT